MKMMEYARRCYLQDLPFPGKYRTGKFTSIDSQEGTICKISGPGVMKRLWTTHHPGDCVKMYVYVDGENEPTLHGYTHELAAAAEKISSPDIPLGGSHFNMYSTVFYLPIRFEKSLRIDMEITDEIRDGVYWQVDYAKDTDEHVPKIVQQKKEGEIQLLYPGLNEEYVSKMPRWVKKEFTLELQGCKPNEPILLEGPAVIRKMEINSDDLDKIGLRMAFDGNFKDNERLDGPFQVNAPLRYLVGKINSACIERLGPKAIIHFPMPFQKEVAIQCITMLNVGDFYNKYRLNIKLWLEREVPDIKQMYYFHARYASAWTNGADDFECCSIRGKGHFVGIHIFDSGHNHGGGDNIFFDADGETAGQLHGICGEDYFHHAYHYTGALLPYAGCPAHGDRYRHHLEMPIPFEKSFVFNWGVFAGQNPKAVSFWYQKSSANLSSFRELTYRVTGPFPLKDMDKLAPGEILPEKAYLAEGRWYPGKQWLKRSQQGFVDLCHSTRQYEKTFAEADGILYAHICFVLETWVWVARDVETEFLMGCDDPIRVYVNGECLLRDEGRNEPDPFMLFDRRKVLTRGLNSIRVVVGNLPNANWLWFGFSLVLRNDLSEEEMCFLT